VKAHRAASGAKGEEKSGDWHQPWGADHKNPCGRRWQGPTTSSLLKNLAKAKGC